MTKIKICGLKRPEDIRAVNEAQPDFAGFVIEVSKSRRNVSVEQVRELAKGLSEQIQAVGVFVNAPGFGGRTAERRHIGAGTASRQ